MYIHVLQLESRNIVVDNEIIYTSIYEPLQCYFDIKLVKCVYKLH